MIQRCTDCVEKARLRNRDLNAAIEQAKQKAIHDKITMAVCWEQKNGLYIAGAREACRSGALIRTIVSYLREVAA